jgi:hypothetical protein
MMRRSMIAVPLLLAAGTAAADMADYRAGMPRYFISNKTCEQVQALLQSSGKAVLYWNGRREGMMRSGMYVHGRQACRMQQIAVKATVPTSDTRSCRVIACNGDGKAPKG